MALGFFLSRMTVTVYRAGCPLRSVTALWQDCNITRNDIEGVNTKLLLRI